MLYVVRRSNMNLLYLVNVRFLILFMVIMFVDELIISNEFFMFIVYVNVIYLVVDMVMFVFNNVVVNGILFIMEDNIFIIKLVFVEGIMLYICKSVFNVLMWLSILISSNILRKNRSVLNFIRWI